MSSMEKKLDTSIYLFNRSKLLLYLLIYIKSLTRKEICRHKRILYKSHRVNIIYKNISHYMKSVDGDFNAES